MCFMFAPASKWKEEVERIAHHTHADVKQYAAQLVCDCSNKPALRKSKQALEPGSHVSDTLQKRV